MKNVYLPGHRYKNYYGRSEAERVLFTNMVDDLVGEPAGPDLTRHSRFSNANISGTTGGKWSKIYPHIVPILNFHSTNWKAE